MDKDDISVRWDLREAEDMRREILRPQDNNLVFTIQLYKFSSHLHSERHNKENWFKNTPQRESTICHKKRLRTCWKILQVGFSLTHWKCFRLFVVRFLSKFSPRRFCHPNTKTVLTDPRHNIWPMFMRIWSWVSTGYYSCQLVNEVLNTVHWNLSNQLEMYIYRVNKCHDLLAYLWSVTATTNLVRVNVKYENPRSPFAVDAEFCWCPVSSNILCSKETFSRHGFSYSVSFGRQWLLTRKQSLRQQSNRDVKLKLLFNCRCVVVIAPEYHCTVAETV